MSSIVRTITLGMFLGIVGLVFTAAVCEVGDSNRVCAMAATEKPNNRLPDEPPAARPVLMAKPGDQQGFRDPVTRAIVARRNVHFWEQQLNERLASVREQLAALEPSDFSTVDATSTELKALLAELKEQAQWLLNNRDEFEASLGSYFDALIEAATANQAASQEYLRLAQQEGEEVLAENYRGLGRASAKMAEAMQNRAAAIAPIRQDVSAKLTFVAKSVVFINACERFLDHVQVEENEEVDAYLTELSAYLSKFRDTMEVFKELTDKFNDDQQGA